MMTTSIIIRVKEILFLKKNKSKAHLQKEKEIADQPAKIKGVELEVPLLRMQKVCDINNN